MAGTKGDDEELIPRRIGSMGPPGQRTRVGNRPALSWRSNIGKREAPRVFCSGGPRGP